MNIGFKRFHKNLFVFSKRIKSANKLVEKSDRMLSKKCDKKSDRKNRIMIFVFIGAMVLVSVGAFVFAPPIWQPEYRTVANKPFDAQELFRVDLNTATKQALCSLPGIGEHKAEAILQYRAENGPFDSVDSLEKVKGISAKNVEQLRKYVYVQ